MRLRSIVTANGPIVARLHWTPLLGHRRLQNDGTAQAPTRRRQGPTSLSRCPLGDHGRSCRPIQQIELLGKLMLAAENFTCLNTEALQILKGA
jgi:hypothetical protein